jgi:hypothetical protein
MTSSLPKYIRTEESFAIFSNCIPHAEAFTKMFGYKETPTGAGFVQYCNEDKRMGFKLLGEKCITGFDTFKEDCKDLKSIFKLLDDEQNPAKYIATSSRFIIFSNDFTHKEISNYLFTDFIIQGAGYISLVEINGEIKTRCFGESEELHIKSREIDGLIIDDSFQTELAYN